MRQHGPAVGGEEATLTGGGLHVRTSARPWLASLDVACSRGPVAYRLVRVKNAPSLRGANMPLAPQAQIGSSTGLDVPSMNHGGDKLQVLHDGLLRLPCHCMRLC